MKFSEVDWEVLRTEYEGGATMRDLRQSSGMARKTLARGLRSVGTMIRAQGHRMGVPSPRPKVVDRFRPCSVCSNTTSRIVLSDPLTCRSCWEKARRSTAKGKDVYLLNMYGMSLGEATRRLADQDGSCAICREAIDLFGKAWLGGAVVDHDHQTGEVRGLLCQSCNIAVGLLDENVDRLSHAQRYLATTRATIHETATLFHPTVMLNPDVIEFGPYSRVDAFCKLEGGQGLTIGPHAHLASFVHVLGGGVTILEEGTSFASGSKVISGSNVPAIDRSCSAVAPGNVIEKSFVHIKRNAVVFAGAIVMPGVTVGSNAVIGAGALVLEDVPAGEIWAGMPARRIGNVQ